ncbi:GntR family transcriptional regulator [Nonomuraea mesophila]|uniref:GntR family transcriptional regulator n=1 Tax=Nonomuraea mesophila TaxID=2530382 RepID=UPI001C70A2CB|nr:GntR family transcriptional regulator [Nonomuraea mesophila]
MIKWRLDQPKWVQIATELRARIVAGVYKRGNPLPSERQLVDEFGVARATVRKALAKLIEEGTIYTVFGIGNFVGPPPEDD